MVCSQKSSHHPLLNGETCTYHSQRSESLKGLNCIDFQILKFNYMKLIRTFTLGDLTTSLSFCQTVTNLADFSLLYLALTFIDKETCLLHCHCAHFVQSWLARVWRKWKRKRIAGLVCLLCPGLNGLLYTGSWDLVLQCALPLYQVSKWGECIKSPKRAAGLHGQNLHPSETDAVLEYFPSNISPSPSLFLSLTFCLCPW